MNNKPLGRKDGIVVQELDGEVLIYDLKDNRALCLNETSAFVWQMCDGDNPVSEITKKLSKKLGQPVNEDLVWLAIDQLKKENLIENGAELLNHFEGMNRREVIKKVGFGTMVAVPVVMGLVAPTVHAAASTCPPVNRVACDCGNNANQTGSCGQQTCANGCLCIRTAAKASPGTCG